MYILQTGGNTESIKMQLWIINYPVTGQKVQINVFMVCVLIDCMLSTILCLSFGVLSDYDVTSEAEACFIVRD